MISTQNSKSKSVKKIIVSGFMVLLVSIFAVSCINDASGAFLSVNKEQCTACGQCASVCATTAIRMINNKAVIDPSRCINATGVTCGKCVEICNWNAIQ